ncbi:MAG TPA: DUF4142 domain-containing protein [Bacteroidia bacterium]|nr:DUF4142 domain-containing protein [Bacteroidia bacterium]
MLLGKASTRTALQIAFMAVVLVSTLYCRNNQASNTDQSYQSVAADTTAKGKDKQFVYKAAEINLEEIKMGQLAQQKAVMPDVKNLGKMLEQDHTKLWNELTELAREKSITIPTSLDEDAKNDYEKLADKSGVDFDKNFSDMMVKGHKEAIAMFEKESVHANDADIQSWATTTLPVLQKHLQQAITCSENCKK